MIEFINYDNGLSCTVFDEPFDEYYNIMLDATSDNHRLISNYKTNIIKDMEFMCLWKLGNKSIMYGLQRDQSLPHNVARVFSRFYQPVDGRDSSATPRVELQTVLSFYNNHPKFHERLGIDTLFFTREVIGNKKDRFITSIVEKNGFIKLEESRVYRNTPQHFYVLGDTSFVTALPLALVGPSN